MVFEQIQKNSRIQGVLGIISGMIFGFLLQKGGVTDYQVIIGQLLLTDFTVVKVMLSAVLVGMIGVYTLKNRGLIRLHCKEGSVGTTVVGGLIFGAGFALLGYCPGTAAGATGTGAVDAAIGMIGIVIGAGIFARLYPYLHRMILNRGKFPSQTIPEITGIKPEIIVTLVAMMIIGLFYLLSQYGL